MLAIVASPSNTSKPQRGMSSCTRAFGRHTSPFPFWFSFPFLDFVRHQIIFRGGGRRDESEKETIAFTRLALSSQSRSVLVWETRQNLPPTHPRLGTCPLRCGAVPFQMVSVALAALAIAWSPIATVRNAKSVRGGPTRMAADLIIWDCDGCLVDSEALLKTAEVEALHAAGFLQVTRDDCNRLFSGYSPEAGAKNFLNEFGKPVPDNFFKDQIEGSIELFRNRLTQLNAKTVLALHAAGRKQVVASGSPRDRVLVCLEVAGIDHVFAGKDQVFTREDVPGRGKPQPDIFLMAAAAAGVDPSQCVVVEDSTSGVMAAQAAKMEVVGFLGGGHAQAEWYREKLASYKIPLTYTDSELLKYLS